MHSNSLWLSRFAKLVVFATLCLIFLGGMVTSLGAGLSVPDWPTSFGFNMFAFPFSRWVGPVFWEHTHRLAASAVGMLTIVLAIWTWRDDRRPWVRGVAAGAVALVVVQGIMGGLRVTRLSIALAIAHGCAAQAFLCAVTLLAMALSPEWLKPGGQAMARAGNWKRWAWALTGAVYVQLILGATMRYLGAGLAIPTFPLTPDGTLMPRVHNTLVDIHFTHRFWAVVVAVLAGIVVTKVLRAAYDGDRFESRLLRPAVWLAGLVAIQIILGAAVIWLLRAPLPTSLHVINGAAVLMIGFILAVRGSRFAFLAANAAGPAPVSQK